MDVVEKLVSATIEEFPTIATINFETKSTAKGYQGTKMFRFLK